MEDYTTTNYTYIVDGANTYHDSVNDSAPAYGMLPIGSGANTASPDQLASTISDMAAGIPDWVNMHTEVFVNNNNPDSGTSAVATAKADFSGEFVAPALATNLIIEYDFGFLMDIEGRAVNAFVEQNSNISFMISGGEYLSPTYFNPLAGFSNAYISVFDENSDSAAGSDAQSYTIPITPGEIYEVSAHLDRYANMQGNAVAIGLTDLNYGMSVEVAVAPEPVSSALFVVGAATLVFSSYRRKKRVS